MYNLSSTPKGPRLSTLKVALLKLSTPTHSKFASSVYLNCAYLSIQIAQLDALCLNSILLHISRYLFITVDIEHISIGNLRSLRSLALDQLGACNLPRALYILA